jgi:hypothetical protein
MSDLKPKELEEAIKNGIIGGVGELMVCVCKAVLLGGLVFFCILFVLWAYSELNSDKEGEPVTTIAYQSPECDKPLLRCDVYSNNETTKYFPIFGHAALCGYVEAGTWLEMWKERQNNYNLTMTCVPHTGMGEYPKEFIRKYT